MSKRCVWVVEQKSGKPTARWCVFSAHKFRDAAYLFGGQAALLARSRNSATTFRVTKYVPEKQ